MGLFKRNRENQIRDARPDHLGARIGRVIVRLERGLAGYLNRKTAGCSSRCWLMLLIGFCALVSAHLLHLLVGVFN